MDTRTDNEPSKKDKAEGSRENLNLGEPSPSNLGGDAGAPMERGPGQVSQPEKPLRDVTERRPRQVKSGQDAGDSDSGGITNRPLDEEQRNQRELPPRGSERQEKRDRPEQKPQE